LAWGARPVFEGLARGVCAMILRVCVGCIYVNLTCGGGCTPGVFKVLREVYVMVFHVLHGVRTFMFRVRDERIPVCLRFDMLCVSRIPCLHNRLSYAC
jgi:hypothetical protein